VEGKVVRLGDREPRKHHQDNPSEFTRTSKLFPYDVLDMWPLRPVEVTCSMYDAGVAKWIKSRSKAKQMQRN
jgi:hypothetical protein